MIHGGSQERREEVGVREGEGGQKQELGCCGAASQGTWAASRSRKCREVQCPPERPAGPSPAGPAGARDRQNCEVVRLGRDACEHL